MTIKMYAYKNGSASAKALADALGIKMLLKKGSKFRGKKGDVILNWGCSEFLPDNVLGNAEYTNHPDNIGNACDKLRTQIELGSVANPYTLPYTTDKDVAENWVNRGETVVCRTILNGHSGAGIVIAGKLEDLVDAPLYTIYKKKADEYRIHVFNGKIIDVQRKARRKEVPGHEVNWQVRNLEGGFIFARDGVLAPKSVCKAALTAVRDLGLLHGAVDIGYKMEGGTYIYEVNTACGLAGSTLYNYEQAFRNHLGMPLTVAPEGYVPMLEQPIMILDAAEEGLEMPEPDVIAWDNPFENGEVDEAMKAPEAKKDDVGWVPMNAVHIKHGNLEFNIPHERKAELIDLLIENGF